MSKEIEIPMQIPGMALDPPISGDVLLSDDMQQTAALLLGYSVNQRVMCKASPEGVLRTTSPRLTDVQHLTGSGANDLPALPDFPCSEVLVMGHPDNTGTIWVRSGADATVNNAWPVAANDVVNFSVDNAKQLSILTVVDGDKAILAIAL